MEEASRELNKKKIRQQLPESRLLLFTNDPFAHATTQYINVWRERVLLWLRFSSLCLSIVRIQHVMRL